MAKAAFIYSSEFDKFSYPPECPFNVSRTGEVRKLIASIGLLSGKNIIEVSPKVAERIVLKKFHSAKYLKVLKKSAEGKFNQDAYQMGIGTPDCPVLTDMYDYSALACGATITGAELILSGQADYVFNPSGGLHHAGPEHASGFCYMNDVVLGCLMLAEAGKRVLYLDIDVHHGDGVANAFYERNDVMTISFHESGKTLFPGTGFIEEIGTGEGKGYCVNVPLIVGTYDLAYMRVFGSIALPLIKAYNPDVVVFELGADALAGDPLAHLRLTNNTYADIIKCLLAVNKPILMTGGGGYNIENTVRAWSLAWSVLSGADEHDINLGIGGVMMESTEWQGGLRDRQLPVSDSQSELVEPATDAVIEAVKKNVFSYHGL